MKKALSIVLVLPIAFTGCSGLSTGQQRELSGAGIGAAVGAIGTAIFHGNPIWGAVGGAAVGAAGGYVYNEYEKNKQAEYNKGYAAGQKSSSSSSSSSAKSSS